MYNVGLFLLLLMYSLSQALLLEHLMAHHHHHPAARTAVSSLAPRLPLLQCLTFFASWTSGILLSAEYRLEITDEESWRIRFARTPRDNIASRLELVRKSELCSRMVHLEGRGDQNLYTACCTLGNAAVA